MTKKAAAAASSTSSLTKPQCKDKCGNLSIPYPFGIGNDPNCFRNKNFQLTCTTTTTGENQLLFLDNLPVLNISLHGQLTTSIPGATKCYMDADKNLQGNDDSFVKFSNAYRVSDTRNRLTIVGCDTNGALYDYSEEGFYVGCTSKCLNDTKVKGLPCNGIGCCQTTIPKGITDIDIYISSRHDFNYTWQISRCGIVVLSDQDALESQVSHLWNIRNNVKDLVNIGIRSPLVLDWAIRNETCEEAQGMKNYACGENTYCYNSTNGPGYRCHCLEGYDGNPYLQNGCQDRRPGCQNKCGNVSIPYPFGLVGDDPTCYKNDDFKLFCNTATDPPNLMIYGHGSRYSSILNISLEGQMITSIWGAVICNMEATKGLRSGISVKYKFPNTYRLSDTRNRLITVGCDTYGSLYGFEGFYVDCPSSCFKDTKVTGLSCAGNGCCQKMIPNDVNDFGVYVDSQNDFQYTWNISRCGFAMLLSDQHSFATEISHFWDIRNNVEYLINVGIQTSIVLDWAIRNQACEEARGLTGHACGRNTYCINSTNGPGYLCHCMQGYQGNPYLLDGCRGIMGDISTKGLFFNMKQKKRKMMSHGDSSQALDVEPIALILAKEVPVINLVKEDQDKRLPPHQHEVV
ncbi:PREDICTED: uncharacterized protein LOC104596858 [Nelumbo nucifera]|uniref:Uncharacterized protein LOC104596858 n=1 Tax=Nelumbo nucifera TaxID=4432 RepID=A0A1U7ZW91_NELNU|nr:PREDICTED: uncharacterized protein LOC104596858 [Nelumbo nucifera]